MGKKIGKIFKFSVVTLLFVATAVYMAVAMTNMTTVSPDEVCTKVHINITKSPKANFMDNFTVVKLLKDANLYPEGKKLLDVNTREIEKFLCSNEFVRKVDCYKSASGVFCIDVAQRIPSAYVLPEDGDGYFVDREGAIVSNTIYNSNLVVVTGQVEKDYVSKKIFSLTNYIQDNPFWDNQIEQIHVTKEQNGSLVLSLVPRVGDHIIRMGTVDDYDKKLKRLKVFYEKALNVVGWNKYKTINIQYDNQIICTKHKN